MEKVTVAYWPRGYAHEEGTSKIVLDRGTSADYLAEIRKSARAATISSVSPVTPAQTETYSPEYIRDMSVGG